MPHIRPVKNPSFLVILQIALGLVLISLSTYLALESSAYLEVLNQSGLNQYHAFGLLVCFSLFSGIFLIVQQVWMHASDQFGAHFEELLPY